jgi:hypothetical protein
LHRLKNDVQLIAHGDPQLGERCPTAPFQRAPGKIGCPDAFPA